MIRAGVCGWCRAQDEVVDGVSTLEVQRTFYQPPKVSTAERWRTKADEVPGDFAFTVEVWQLVTHPPSSPTYSQTSEEIEDAHRFSERARDDGLEVV